MAYNRSVRKESEFLKKRAQEFWERAREDLEKGRYNLSVFDVEQAVQLWLKYLIFQKAGDFPKTHYLDSLIKNLAEIYNLPKLTEYYSSHTLEFKSLEDAYLTSRYFPKDLSESEAKKFLEFASLFLKTLENETGQKFV